MEHPHGHKLSLTRLVKFHDIGDEPFHRATALNGMSLALYQTQCVEEVIALRRGMVYAGPHGVAARLTQRTDSLDRAEQKIRKLLLRVKAQFLSLGQWLTSVVAAGRRHWFEQAHWPMGEVQSWAAYVSGSSEANAGYAWS